MSPIRLLLLLTLFGVDARADERWGRIDVGSGVLIGRHYPAGGRPLDLLGPVITFDAVKGERFAMISPNRYGFWGLTAALAPQPTIGGITQDGAIGWAALGGGLQQRFGASGAWGIEGSAYLGMAGSWLSPGPFASTNFTAFVQARVGRRWRREGTDHYAIDAAALWFRGVDDEVSEYVTHHGVFTLNFAWSTYGDRPTRR